MNMKDLDISKKISIEMYYISDITPNENFEEAHFLLKKLREQKNIEFKIFEKMSEEDSKILEDEIRMAATRGKFRVVSGGGAALALSGSSKKLNHQHGPILIVRIDNTVTKVYPSGEQGIKGSRIKAIDFLKEVINSDSFDIFDLDIKTFTEQDFRNLIIRRPTLIEDNLTFSDVEVNVESAVIDLIFIDADGNHLLLECKLNTTDQTVGQVTRYNEEIYAKLQRIPKNKIRKGIATLSITGQLQEACKSNEIELYLLKFKNVGFSRRKTLNK